MPKGLLVSYAGQPYTPSSLMPDNGLASLAGSLIDAGNEVSVVDYGLPELSEQLVPDKQTETLKQIFDSFSSGNTSKISQLYNFINLKLIHRKLQGMHSRVVDRIAQDLSDRVSAEKPDFVGFKLWNGDGFEGTRKIALKLKKDHPQLQLFGGGPHAYSFGNLIFDYIPLDAICYDEGENTIKELARVSSGSARLSDVPNIFFKKGNEIQKTPLEKILDLNSLPYPEYSKEVYENIEKKMNIFIIDETRGCMYSCPFCIQSSREDNRYRTKSPERIVSEMRKLVVEKDATHFRFGGQMTLGTLLEKIAEQILDEGLEVDYTCFGHVNSMKSIDFNTLRESGLVAVFYGIESGSQELLQKAFHKKTKPEDIKQVLMKTREAGIKSVASMIYPAPFETEETRQETMNLLKETQPDSVLAYFPGLYPNTTWQRNPSDFGFEITSHHYEEDVMKYKIITIFPPRFWQSLPYKVNGMNYKQYAKMTEDFCKELSENNQTMFLTDEHYIIARAAGMNPKELSYNLQKTFFSGDNKKQEELVYKINRK